VSSEGKYERGTWMTGFQCALHFISLKEYYAVGKFNPDKTAELLKEITGELPERYGEIVELLDDFREAHENGNNVEARRVLDRIISQLEQLS
jgi:septation ring formation regulator EzrA